MRVLWLLLLLFFIFIKRGEKRVFKGKLQLYSLWKFYTTITWSEYYLLFESTPSALSVVKLASNSAMFTASHFLNTLDTTSQY